MRCFIFIFFLLFFGFTSGQSLKPRARDLGIPFEGTPGPYNAITDVPGVLVGYKTLIKEAAGPGKAPVRTGVTVILPKGKTDSAYTAGWFSLNGDGEMTGTTVIEEYGMGIGAIGITNTNSVGVVRDAIGSWNIQKFAVNKNAIDFSFGLPVVAETYDGLLNDINGLHVQNEHVWEALESARGGPVAEGNVGGGTGMSLFHFKGGSGTASRVIKIDTASYTIGVFVQGNFGGRNDLMISGVPVGREIKGFNSVINKPKDGSIIVIIATDAPLLPSFLKLLAKRATIGIARTGGFAYNGSGDIFLAFSTASPRENEKGTLATYTTLPKEQLDRLYKATATATEEAIINAMIAAETMKGINNNQFYALPHDQVQEILKKYGRLTGKK